ncbi:OPT/YSL family transporter, partial [Candidatus Collinsella stercoripullorum]
ARLRRAGDRAPGADAAPRPRTGFVSRLISRYDAGVLALMAASAALVVCFALGLGPVVAVAVVLLAFVTAVMSAQSVGQSGIDPMEIFGLIVLLFVAAFSSATQVQLFFVAGVIAVACGLAGDVMSDFKTGQIIGTSPRSMWFGQAIGAVLGTFVAVAVMVALVSAYGPDAFGADRMFVSAQASVVATMVTGVPSLPAFVVGLVAGAVLYCAGIPSMMLGLGVYLPFYMSLTTVLGAVVRWVYDRVCAARGQDAAEADEAGVVVASGVLGGESIVGVIVAFATVGTGLFG